MQYLLLLFLLLCAKGLLRNKEPTTSITPYHLDLHEGDGDKSDDTPNGDPFSPQTETPLEGDAEQLSNYGSEAEFSSTNLPSEVSFLQECTINSCLNVDKDEAGGVAATDEIAGGKLSDTVSAAAINEKKDKPSSEPKSEPQGPPPKEQQSIQETNRPKENQRKDNTPLNMGATKDDDENCAPGGNTETKEEGKKIVRGAIETEVQVEGKAHQRSEGEKGGKTVSQTDAQTAGQKDANAAKQSDAQAAGGKDAKATELSDAQNANQRASQGEKDHLQEKEDEEEKEDDIEDANEEEDAKKEEDEDDAEDEEEKDDEEETQGGNKTKSNHQGATKMEGSKSTDNTVMAEKKVDSNQDGSKSTDNTVMAKKKVDSKKENASNGGEDKRGLPPGTNTNGEEETKAEAQKSTTTIVVEEKTEIPIDSPTQISDAKTSVKPNSDTNGDQAKIVPPKKDNNHGVEMKGGPSKGGNPEEGKGFPKNNNMQSAKDMKGDMAKENPAGEKSEDKGGNKQQTESKDKEEPHGEENAGETKEKRSHGDADAHADGHAYDDDDSDAEGDDDAEGGEDEEEGEETDKGGKGRIGKNEIPPGDSVEENPPQGGRPEGGAATNSDIHTGEALQKGKHRKNEESHGGANPHEVVPPTEEASIGKKSTLEKVSPPPAVASQLNQQQDQTQSQTQGQKQNERRSKTGGKNYESSMYTLDKKMHKNLSNVDVILHGLKDKLNRHKDLKNRELKLKFEAMGRIKEYKLYKDLIQQAVEIVTLRLMKINEDLRKLKHSSDVALQKYINENGYQLVNFSDSTKYDSRNGEKAQEEKVSSGTNHRGDEKKNKLFCPMDCIRKSCHNKPNHPTQCYKLEQRGSQIQKICEPFSDLHSGTCPPDFHHCAIAEPERNKKYSIFASGERGQTPQFISIRGYNLHECLQMLVVNKGSMCSPSTIEKNILESQDILLEPVFTKLLHNEILLENIKINTPGEYNICLAQFYHQPDGEDLLTENGSNRSGKPSKPGKANKARKNDIRILGIDTIGTLYVLPLPSSK
ncbi:hypothetical protein C922_02748 [Plasmodium inui San Antonio 1]|uniref:Rhoptry neck protein 6 n=1 Tax=Plasmodium inui San Antonio 1 TaxID=1237626 RepID=W7A6B6_9APIC|nr:hypothetical protein C922_02748 [Plasmodium inui San Antonio 1]EUD66763.1 hypothetical protein C922_02748 [Plasmodium inui San Antonio 1]